MTVSLKHKFTSAKSDGTDSTIVQPSNWNDEHAITLAAGKVLGRDTSGNGAVQELPLAFDPGGQAMVPPAGTTAQRPSSPVAGMIRYNTTFSKFEQYNGSSWGAIGGGAYIGDSAPSASQPGDLWWKSDEGQMYVYYNDGTSSQWVVGNAFAGGAAYLPRSGGTLTGALLGTTATFTSFSGDGSSLTNVNASQLGGKSVGTSANNVVALDGSAKLPAVDGSQLIGLSSGFSNNRLFAYAAFTGTTSGTTLTVTGSVVGQITIGMVITGTSVTAGTTITGFGTGTGGTGTYTISASQTLTSRAFTASTATWTVPTGITKAKVTVVGAGASAYETNGTNGGTTSFGAYCSATGGTAASGGGSGGTATGGDLNLPGNNGTQMSNSGGGGAGGAGALYSLGKGENGKYYTTGTGCSKVSHYPDGGGSGGTAVKTISGLTPGTNISLTLGAPGGTSSGGGGGGGAGDGTAGQGVIIIEW